MLRSRLQGSSSISLQAGLLSALLCYKGVNIAEEFIWNSGKTPILFRFCQATRKTLDCHRVDNEW